MLWSLGPSCGCFENYSHFPYFVSSDAIGYKESGDFGRSAILFAVKTSVLLWSLLLGSSFVCALDIIACKFIFLILSCYRLFSTTGGKYLYLISYTINSV